SWIYLNVPSRVFEVVGIAPHNGRRRGECRGVRPISRFYAGRAIPRKRYAAHETNLQPILPPHVLPVAVGAHLDDAGVEERGDVWLQCREIDNLSDVRLQCREIDNLSDVRLQRFQLRKILSNVL